MYIHIGRARIIRLTKFYITFNFILCKTCRKRCVIVNGSKQLKKTKQYQCSIIMINVRVYIYIISSD